MYTPIRTYRIDAYDTYQITRRPAAVGRPVAWGFASYRNGNFRETRQEFSSFKAARDAARKSFRRTNEPD